MKLLHAAGIDLINTVTAIMNTAIIIASRTALHYICFLILLKLFMCKMNWSWDSIANLQ
jgi:hypothetical protein